jgi:LPXTG-motif cell wall-anchored protein
VADWGAGQIDLVAETSAGRSNPLPFTFAPSPVINMLQNVTAPITGGTKVTAYGLNFVPGATTVTFGSEAATDVSCTTTTCTFTSPPAAVPGKVDVILHTAQGASNAMPFRYFPLTPALGAGHPAQAGPDTEQPTDILPVTGGADNGIGTALMGALAILGGALLMWCRRLV